MEFRKLGVEIRFSLLTFIHLTQLWVMLKTYRKDAPNAARLPANVRSRDHGADIFIWPFVSISFSTAMSDSIAAKREKKMKIITMRTVA